MSPNDRDVAGLTPSAHRSNRVRFSVGLVMLLGVVTFAPRHVPGAAASPVGAARQAPAVGLELIDQDFAVDADGVIRLVYRLTGPLADLEITPPTTTTTTTAPPTTTSTVAPTTPPTSPPPTTAPTEAAPDPTPAPSPPPPTTAAPTTTTTLPPPPLELALQVTNYRPITSELELDRILGSDVVRTAFGTAIDGVELLDLRDRISFAEDGAATFVLEVGVDSGESVESLLRFDAPGLYPVRVELLAGPPDARRLVATHGTVVQRLAGVDDPADRSVPVNLAFVGAVPEVGPLAPAAQLDARVADLTALAEFAAALDTPMSLAVPPAVVEAVDDLEPIALELDGDELVALPADPLDVSSAAAIDRVDAFAQQVRAGEDLLADLLPTVSTSRDVWIAREPISAAGAQVLRDLGYRIVVMTRALYRESVSTTVPATDRLVELELPDGGTLPLLLIDPLAEQLTVAAGDEALAEEHPTEWAVRTVAQLLLDHQRNGERVNRSLVLSSGQLGPLDARLAAALERLADTAPNVRFVDAAALPRLTDTQRVAGEPLRVDLPEEAGPSLAERIALIDATKLQLANVASMLGPDDPRPALWTAELDALVSTGFDDDFVATVSDRLLDEASALTDAVIPPEPFTFTLTGRRGEIEMRIGNRADEELAVLLRLSSSKLAFPNGDELVLLRPNGETFVTVPVQARSNGTSSVRVEILTPAGNPLGEPVTLTSRVRALTGLAQVLTGGLLLVLATWWLAHWRARRRERVTVEGGRVEPAQ